MSGFLYLSIFLTTSLLAELSTKLKNKITIDRISKGLLIVLLLFIPSFFSGIRYGIGTDYFSYVKMFDRINNGVLINTEIGYKLLNYLIGVLGGNVQILFFLVTFITFSFVYFFLRNYRGTISVGLGMFVFFLLYYSFSFNAVRSSISMAISLYSYKFIEERKILKFIIFSLLSLSFHNSAIITLPMYFLYNYFGEKNKFHRVIIYLIIIVLIANYQPIIQYASINIFEDPKYLRYATGVEPSIGIGLFVIFAPFILPGLVYYKELINEDSRFKFYFFMFLSGYIIKFVGYFGGEYLNRIAEHFIVVLVWLIPYYYSYFKKRKETYLIAVSILVWTVLYWYINFIYIGTHQTVPYISIFN